MDATYRGDLRELNELNFARFRAEVDAGFARADAKLEQRVAEIRAELQGGFARADARLDQRIAELRSEMHLLETRLTKRMFGFWVAQSATTVAVVLGVVKLMG